MGERDKGFAWIILAAASLGQACVISVTMGAIGSLYVEILNFYPENTKTDVSWVASIQTATVGIMSGILVPVVKKRGCRVVCVVGVLLGVVGLLISTFARTLKVLYFTFGFCSGIANVSFQVTSFTAVLGYFHQRRALALGIMFACGNSGGYFLGPPLTVILVETFTLPGSFLVMAGIMMQCVWLGCLFRPLNEKEHNSDRTRTKECQTAIENSNNEVDIVDGPCIDTESSQLERRACILKTLKPLVSTFGLDPCKNVTYIIFFWSLYLHYMGYMLPNTFMILRGVMAGESEARSALLMTVFAAVAMVCRLLTGVIGDYIKDWRGHVYCGAVIMNGVLAVVTAGFNTYYLLMAYAVAFGIISGIYVVLQGTMVVDYWGTEIIEYYSGHVWVALGLASFTITPISAMLIDETESTTLPFIIFGSLQIIGGMGMFFSIILQKRQNQRSRSR